MKMGAIPCLQVMNIFIAYNKLFNICRDVIYNFKHCNNDYSLLSNRMEKPILDTELQKLYIIAKI